jgi:hypothetical protein
MLKIFGPTTEICFYTSRKELERGFPSREFRKKHACGTNELSMLLSFPQYGLPPTKYANCWPVL